MFMILLYKWKANASKFLNSVMDYFTIGIKQRLLLRIARGHF
jgi:hypothetical protein